jgi:hypothetical protein
VTCTVSECLADTTSWPPAGFNDPGCDVEISASYTSAISSGGQMLAGGAFINVMGNNMPGYSRQMVVF